jgi:KUP system potassium uptake protein
MALALGAIGVVFGDIGTSPMYAIAESLHTPGLPADQLAVLGIISLIIWTLFLIVSVKYLLFVTAADNEGEGGIFAIVALLRRRATTGPRFQLGLTVIALASVGLLFADSLITPPLSIMAALEGLESVSPGAKEWVIPGTLVIMLALFLIQRFGTAFLGRLFGPIMLVWFLTLAGLGLVQVIQAPEILTALNPIHALRLVGQLNLTQILSLMGSVLLAVTGAEAIYADMGHFGRRPIVLSWYFVALNALLLSYLGQGAWLLHTQSFGPAEVSPFFSIVPKGWEVPMVVLAAAASVIASQAVISGLFFH